MTTKNPRHPGLAVRHDCLEPLGLSVTEAAKRLDVSRKQLSDIVNCHAGISPKMAIRLDKAFGGSAEAVLRRGCDSRLPMIWHKRGITRRQSVSKGSENQYEL